MLQARRLKAVGVALHLLGAGYMVAGLWGGLPAFRLMAPVLAFMGIVLLAQSSKKT